MTGDASRRETGLRHQADERPPAALALGLGLQLTLLIVTIPILVPTIVMRAAGADEPYVAWAAFAAVVVCGLTTALHAVRYGRIGSGHVMVMGSATAFIWLCIEAVQKSGPAMLVTLVIACALLQFVLSSRIAYFRRVLTATVSGTVLMLVPVTAMPVIFGMLTEAPQGSPVYAAILSAAVTVAAIVGIALKAGGGLRLWAPVIGLAAGTAVAGILGLYETERVAAAPWVGLPVIAWPGIDLGFGADFWSLLPGFLLVTLIVTLRSISSSVAVQSVSWRRPRAVDYRAVQGAVNVDGISNLLSGAAGTIPNTAYGISAPLAELTGVAARSVGIVTGALFVLLAFLPKALAVVLAIPSPVVGAYLGVLMAMLFLIGLKVLIQDGLDYRKGLIAGIAFWIGVGFQSGMIFPEQISTFAGGLLANAVTSGGLAAILMTLFLLATEPRRRRMEAELDAAALPQIREFLRDFAARNGWGDAMAERLDAVGEEALLSILQPDEGGERPGRRLRLSARRKDRGAVLEFVVAPRGGNIQDRLATLADHDDESATEQEVSLRLLRHLASSVRHQQYHEVDIVTVQVQAPTAGE